MFLKGSAYFFLPVLAVAICAASPAAASPTEMDFDDVASHSLGVLKKQFRESASSVEDNFEPTLATVSAAFLKLFPQYKATTSPSCELQTNQEENKDILYLYSETAEPSLIAVQVTHDSRPNAFALEESASGTAIGTIVLSGGLLQLIRDDGELSFVLAHEMHHIRHKHSYEEPFLEAMLSPKQREHIAEVHRQWELAADKEALRVMTGAGFGLTSSVSLLSRLSQFERPLTAGLADNHPSINTRIEAIAASQTLSFLAPSAGNNF